jgi:hypothetical protein
LAPHQQLETSNGVGELSQQSCASALTPHQAIFIEVSISVPQPKGVLFVPSLCEVCKNTSTPTPEPLCFGIGQNKIQHLAGACKMGADFRANRFTDFSAMALRNIGAFYFTQKHSHVHDGIPNGSLQFPSPKRTLHYVGYLRQVTNPFRLDA